MQRDLKAVKFALNQIDDGRIFEEFAKAFLASRLGYTFMPAGDIKDRGIDGLNFLFFREGHEKIIYQMSKSKDPKAKLKDSLVKIKNNNISCERFIYTTNKKFKDQDLAIDDLFDQFKIPITIYDLDWFAANVNHSQGTLIAYTTFVESHLHHYTLPGTGTIVSDLLSDPRLYVFLRQQWDIHHSQKPLVDLVTDSLILYSLEETNPDMGKLMCKAEMIKTIEEKLKFFPQILQDNMDKRLSILSKKSNKKINHHTKNNTYCLPYETRQELIEKNLQDARLHSEFTESCKKSLEENLKLEGAIVRETLPLIEATLNKIFYKQGLEFSELVENKTYKDSFNNSLPDIVDEVVNESTVIEKNRKSVKIALLKTIRALIYTGTPDQKKYLRSLSNTYMLLFTLHCDPKVATYFSTMANKLNLFVDNSILIPTMSEIFLAHQNRRYWNLLNGAKITGVKLKVNDTIIDELVSHIKKIKNLYEIEYIGTEDIYCTDEAISSIPEILLRAYFYAVHRNKVTDFNTFLDTFCNPSLNCLKQDMIDFVNTEFNILYIPNNNMGIDIDEKESKQLSEALEKSKGAGPKAENDANLILSIYALRNKNNEGGKSGIYGYNTWWLSTDTTTGKVVQELFKDKYSLSCYMRPDFLYNYISLSPSIELVEDVYREIFPGLHGVNLSHNIPDKMSKIIRKEIEIHKNKNHSRLVSAIRELSDKLKTDPSSINAKSLKSFFNDKLEK